MLLSALGCSETADSQSRFVGRSVRADFFARYVFSSSSLFVVILQYLTILLGCIVRGGTKPSDRRFRPFFAREGFVSEVAISMRRETRPAVERHVTPRSPRRRCRGGVRHQKTRYSIIHRAGPFKACRLLLPERAVKPLWSYPAALRTHHGWGVLSRWGSDHLHYDDVSRSSASAANALCSSPPLPPPSRPPPAPTRPLCSGTNPPRKLSSAAAEG